MFVGGTGRSGTTIVARLLGAHPRFAYVPTEVRFHAEARGLPGLLAGRVGYDEFLERMRTRWYHLYHPNGRPRALTRLIGTRDFEAALGRFEAAWPGDRWAAARGLVEDLLGPTAAAASKSTWIEMSPPNATAAQTLLALFPGARVVHSVRDGRDVAASLIRRGAPLTMEQALDRWASRMWRAHRWNAGVDRTRFLTLPFYDLVAGPRRAATYGSLLAGLGIERARAMDAFLEREITPERARMGHWREGRTAAEMRAVDAHYQDILRRLGRRGVDLAGLCRGGLA